MERRLSDYPHADTDAAHFFASALAHKQRQGVSLRKLAKQLGYKQAAALSHMAMGRIPIPIERVPDFASTLGIPVDVLLDAALRQRYPAVKWETFRPGGRDPGDFVFNLEGAAGRSVSELTDAQVRIIQEVAASADAARRWVSPAEAGVVEMLRRAKPEITTQGLTRAEAEAIEADLRRR